MTEQRDFHHYQSEANEICKNRGWVRNIGNVLAGGFAIAGVVLIAIGHDMEKFGAGSLGVGIVVAIWSHWDNVSGQRSRDELTQNVYWDEK